MSELEPSAFISSRMTEPMKVLRSFAKEHGNSLGIWVSAPLFAERQDRETIQQICLKEARNADYFIGVLDGSYGTPWNQAELSVLELEIFTAALLQKPGRIWLVEPFEPDERMRTLLAAVQVSAPYLLQQEPQSLAKTREEIQQFLEQIAEEQLHPQRFRLGFLQQILASRRSTWKKRFDFQHDIAFLGGTSAPLSAVRPDFEEISALVSLAQEEDHHPSKLVNLWSAIRHLSNAPYSDPQYEKFVPLWEGVLGMWVSAASWGGLHGHLYLGCLAGLNSLAEIRARFPNRNSLISQEQHTASTRSALASEYYSIAKRLPSRIWRGRAYDRALLHCEAALQDWEGERSGVQAIRGHIYLRTGRVNHAIQDFRAALRIRTEAGENCGRIGDAQTALGVALLRGGRIFSAGRYLEEGLHNLRQSDETGFLIQGLRRASEFYKVTLRKEKAKDAAIEAYKIAKTQELEGQREQILPLLEKFGISPEDIED